MSMVSYLFLRPNVYFTLFGQEHFLLHLSVCILQSLVVFVHLVRKIIFVLKGFCCLIRSVKSCQKRHNPFLLRVITAFGVYTV